MSVITLKDDGFGLFLVPFQIRVSNYLTPFSDTFYILIATDREGYFHRFEMLQILHIVFILSTATIAEKIDFLDGI